MKKLKRLGILVPLFMHLLTLAQQESMITGTVIDATTRLPLAGVSVQLKNSGVQTITTGEGKFSIQLATAVDTLFLSHVSFNLIKRAVSPGNEIQDLHFEMTGNSGQL